MRLTLALSVAAALSACATQSVEQSTAELRQSHGYVVAAVPLVIGADAPVVIIRSTASGREYTLSAPKPGAGTRGLWVPKGTYEITSELGPRTGVSEPIQVEPGKVTDLGGLVWAGVGNRQRILLPIRHPDLSADIAQALAPLKAHVASDAILWRPSQVPMAQPVPVAMANLGLIGALLMEYEAEVNKTPLRARLRSARNLAEFTGLFLDSATPVLGEPDFDASGQLYIGSNFGRLRVRDDQGNWRTIDTGAISPIMAVAVGADRWVVGTHDGQLLEGKSGAQVWTRVHQFTDGESVMSLARAGSRYVVLTGHFAGTARQGFQASFDGLQVYLFDPAARPQLRLLKKLEVSSSSPFTRRSTLQGSAAGKHVFLNAGESVERLDMATLAWKTVSPSHDVSHLRSAGDGAVLTAFKAQGLFSKLSISTDFGETWVMGETPPYPVHEIRMESLATGTASRWDTGAFSVALQTMAFDAPSKSWRATWTAPQSACVRTIRDAQGKEAWCVSGEEASCASAAAASWYRNFWQIDIQVRHSSTHAPMKTTSTLLLVLALAGCATRYEPIPENYSGPRASIADTWSLDANERDQVFAVVQLDGKPIVNAVDNTRAASQGRGFQVIKRDAEREVPATKLKLKIIGTHFSSAPIAEIARRAAGTFQSVEGEVDLLAAEGGHYKVTGELSKAGSCVWIADAASNKEVTTKVCSK